MTPIRRMTSLAVCGFFAMALAGSFPSGLDAQEPVPAYQRSSSGTRVLARGGLVIKMLVEQSVLGSGEVEVGEITIPVGSTGGAHRHGAIEIFYVLSGVMDHVVNGESHRLEPGMIGIVRPGDEVSHRVLSEQPVRAVVVWTPGGEADRLAPFFDVTPVAPR